MIRSDRGLLRRFARAAGLAFALLSLPAAVLAAPAVRPWVPTGLDSVSSWAIQARTKFRANTGDSLGGTNFEAYALVGRIGRDLLRSLGRGNLNQAHAVEPVIDSLGLDTEIAIDVTQPYFALLMVRNPFRESADVAGFLYWFHGNDLRFQGVRFTSGRQVIMRVWRNRDPEQAWSWGVLENAHYGSLPMQFSLLRLGANGFYWTAPQYPGHGPDLGGRGDAAFADLNNDGVPELITWSNAVEDSTVLSCEGCPRLVTEQVWSERREGFVLQESRLLPTAFANFVAFTRFLRDGNRSSAARLLANPARVDDAVKLGWGEVKGRGAWRVTAVEPNETWPRWIVVRQGRAPQAMGWVVHFGLKDGRWIIEDWVRERTAASEAPAR